jgi:hypothetical protein
MKIQIRVAEAGKIFDDLLKYNEADGSFVVDHGKRAEVIAALKRALVRLEGITEAGEAAP